MGNDTKPISNDSIRGDSRGVGPFPEADRSPLRNESPKVTMDSSDGQYRGTSEPVPNSGKRRGRK